jgi:uncharacterized membrane protein YraQ (UPF0718 family)
MSEVPPPQPHPRRPRFDLAIVAVLVLSLLSAVVVYRREGLGAVAHIVFEDVWLLLTILPKVAAGCIIGALVRLLVPRETIVRWVGEGSGVIGLAIAAAVGAIFPGGPFTIFPLAAAFLLSGADRGAAVAFITGWLLLGLNRAIIWEMPFFAADFVMLRMALSLPLPVLAGLGARWLDKLLPEGRSKP